MQTLTKHIAHAGEFIASSPDGGRIRVKLTPERLKKWADNFGAMKEAGIKVPAPWAHSTKALPRTKLPRAGEPREPLDASDPEYAKNPYNNAGTWDDIRFDTDSGKLVGEITVPDDVADKLNSSVSEVSPYVLSNFVDGSGRSWEDSIMHVALVNHPIISGQEGFKPSEVTPEPTGTEDAAMAFSFEMSGQVGLYMASGETQNTEEGGESRQGNQGPGGGGSLSDKVQTLKELLKKKKGIDLPGDANTPESVLDQLIGVLAAMNENEQTNDDTNSAPGNARQQPTPVAMSFSSEFLEKNPAVGTLLTEHMAIKRRDYATRIAALVSSGRVNKKHAEEKLLPIVNGVQFSLDENSKLKRNELDTILETLEAMPALTQTTDHQVGPFSNSGTQFSIGDNGKLVEEEIPADYIASGDQELSESEADEIVKKQMANSGY